jgi:hypothetical protein
MSRVMLVCVYCGRTGTRSFVISSGNGDGTRDTYCCANIKACERRRAEAPGLVIVE